MSKLTINEGCSCNALGDKLFRQILLNLENHILLFVDSKVDFAIDQYDTFQITHVRVEGDWVKLDIDIYNAHGFKRGTAKGRQVHFSNILGGLKKLLAEHKEY